MKHLFFLLTLLLCLPLAAQVLTRRSDGSYRFEPLLDRLYKVSQIIPQEKVYIHMDNTCYFQGDIPLNLHGRIIDSGISIFKISF